MPGIFGGTSAAPDASQLVDTPYQEAFHVGEIVADTPRLGVVHHGQRDPDGHTIVADADVAGVVYGVITNERVTPQLIRRIINRPHETLPKLNGPFAIACVDREDEKIVIATDKLGTRQIYYTPTHPVIFGSEVKTPLGGVADPSIDSEAVSDLLLMNKVWGEKTLVNEVRRVRPGSFIEITADELRQHRYWTFTFGDPQTADYSDAVADAYKDAVGSVLGTISSTPGVWLSGGLDSRILAGAMQANGEDFSAVSYDRPTAFALDPIYDDVDVASRVASSLDSEHETIEQDPETLAARIASLVGITDGMVGWHSLVNIGSVFDLDIEGQQVMIEGPVPLLCGEKVEAKHLGTNSVAAATLQALHGRTNPDLVRDVLDHDVDLSVTFSKETVATPFSDHDSQVLQATHENYHSAGHFTTNKIARARVGTRETLANGQLLHLLGHMPLGVRRQRIPFTQVPHVPSPLKLDLARNLGSDLASIPYSTTKLPVSMPYHLHGMCAVGMALVQRSVSQRRLSRWIREDNALAETVESLIRSAMTRPAFDDEAVESMWDEHLAGHDHSAAIAKITTVELFHREVLEIAGQAAEKSRIDHREPITQD